MSFMSHVTYLTVLFVEVDENCLQKIKRPPLKVANNLQCLLNLTILITRTEILLSTFQVMNFKVNG